MNIREAAVLERVPSLMDELAEATKKGTKIQEICPRMSADVARKAEALEASVAALKTALEKSGGQPGPSSVLPPKQPLWQLMNERREYREIAAYVRYDGAHEQDLHEFARA